MKWNKYLDTKPEKEGFYTVRFDEKVRGYQYGTRSFNLCPDGEYKFSKGVGDTNITHWADYTEFQESALMLKRPSNVELVRQYLDEYTGVGLGEIFVDLFTDDEMKQILMEKMSDASFQGIADDEWDDICFKADCEREDRLWRSGYYS